MLLFHDPTVLGVLAGSFYWFPYSCQFLVVVVWLLAAVLFCSCCWNNDAILELTSEVIHAVGFLLESVVPVMCEFWLELRVLMMVHMIYETLMFGIKNVKELVVRNFIQFVLLYDNRDIFMYVSTVVCLEIAEESSVAATA
nr:hypothetical protein [Tanacetum cinerariifolium]